LESIYIIILINVLIFVGVRIQPDYVNSLALVPSEVWSHPWQIITSMFTHYDFTHILFNMWTFYFFGSAILQILGNKKFWLIYMIGGVAGGIAYVLLAYAGNALSFNWLGGINIGAIGASGAIFALGGALAVLRPNMRVVFFPIPVPMPLWVAIVGSFAIFTLLSITNNLGIAWQAHLGGLAFGAAMSWYYKRHSFDSYRWS
jgi:membrane associated rhomboid family serine protease